MIDVPTQYIDNKINLVANRPYGAILGNAPSKGARSPILWRAAFAALGLDRDFHPFDVQESRLPDLLTSLRNDSRFFGGAVAVPYKERILKFVDCVEPEATAIGAINALYRTTSSTLGATNTDGLAAVTTLTTAIGNLAGRRVLCLGTGGAGKAVAASFAAAGADVSIWNRSVNSAHAFIEKLAASGLRAKCMQRIDDVSSFDVLVNCTSAGFSADGNPTDVAPIDLGLIGTLPAEATVFDIIYQPVETILLKSARLRGLRAINGKAMNLEQAVIAFCRAIPGSPEERVRAAMAVA